MSTQVFTVFFNNSLLSSDFWNDSTIKFKTILENINVRLEKSPNKNIYSYTEDQLEESFNKINLLKSKSDIINIENNEIPTLNDNPSDYISNSFKEINDIVTTKVYEQLIHKDTFWRIISLSPALLNIIFEIDKGKTDNIDYKIDNLLNYEYLDQRQKIIALLLKLYFQSDQELLENGIQYFETILNIMLGNNGDQNDKQLEQRFIWLMNWENELVKKFLEILDRFFKLNKDSNNKLKFGFITKINIKNLKIQSIIK